MIVAGIEIRDSITEFTAALRNELCDRLQQAGDEVVRVARKLVNVQGPPRSQSGSPPHRDHSLLYLSIDTEPVDRQDLSIKAGSGIRYALYLELGTSKMLPRPWLQPALAEATPHIRHLFLAPLPHSKAVFRDNYLGKIRYHLRLGF